MIKGKLGKRPPVNKPALKFVDHLTAVPEHPAVDATPSFDYPMDLNDRYGDCVVAGADHTLQTINGLLGQSYTNWTDDQIIAYYKTQNPNFDPASDADDNGMVIQDFLNYLVKQGVILAFAKVDHTNEQEMQAAVYLGLALVIGQVLTQAQEDQRTWDYVANDSEIGGHCTCWIGYNQSAFACVTWGEVLNCTNEFIQHQVDECWFVLTQAHLDNPSFRANYNVESFAEAYKQLTGNDLPVPTPVPGPSPTPKPPTDHHLWNELKNFWEKVELWAEGKGFS